MKIEDIIDELMLIILMQEKENKELKRKINRVNQFIEFYDKENSK